MITRFRRTNLVRARNLARRKTTLRLHVERLEARNLLAIDANAVATTCAIDPDLDNSGVVDRADVAILSSNYGLAADATPDHGDLDGDGNVALSDLPLLRNELSETRIELSSTRIQEDREFNLHLENGVPSSPIDVDILDILVDGSCNLVHEFGPIMTDGAGNVDSPLQMPTAIVPNGLLEYEFHIRVRHGGLNRLFDVTVFEAQVISLSPTTIQEGDPFTITVEGGIGHSQIAVDLFHDGPDPLHDFGFRETNEAGNANLQLIMPRGLLSGIHHDFCTREEPDGFRLQVAHGGVTQIFPITVRKGLEICILPSSNIREREHLRILIKQGVGESRVTAVLSLDGQERGRRVWEPGTNGSGEFNETIEIPNVVCCEASDRFELTVTHGPVAPVFGITIYDSHPDPAPPAPRPMPQPRDPLNPPAPGAPSYPGPLALTVRSTTQIDLSWRNSMDEDGYRVYRRLTNSAWELIGTTATDDTTFSATGLSAGTKYFFKIRAYNGNGSVDSDTASAFTVFGALESPGPISVSVNSANRVDLLWRNSPNEIGYSIHRREINSSSWHHVATVTADVRYYSVQNLTKSTTYYFKVTAFNNSAELASAPAVATTLEIDPGIYVIGHEFALDAWHTSVLLVPDNILDFLDRPGCPRTGEFTDFSYNREGWETYGAEARGVAPPRLVSKLNRPTDDPHANPRSVRVNTGGRSLTSLILEIIQADCRYMDDARYELDPDADDESYNSNSYTSGLLQAVGLPVPTFPSTPGYQKPLPIPSGPGGSPVPSPLAIQEASVSRRNVTTESRPRLAAPIASNRPNSVAVAVVERPAMAVLRAKRLRPTPQRVSPAIVDHLLNTGLTDQPL